ncbi:SsgA family sporulation/cell division regulator [Streptomyces sp. NPDC005047]
MLHSEHGPLIPLVLELRYDQLDPLAVHLGFHSPTGCTSRWRVSRDLLQAGTHCGAGHADVRVWPADEASGQDSLFLRLGSDERTALIEVRRAPFRHWLAHTFTVVPAGQEMAGVDWAEEIRLLLRNG